MVYVPEKVQCKGNFLLQSTVRKKVAAVHVTTDKTL